MTRRPRLRTWFPAFCIYLTAFAVAGFLNIEKISLWAEDRIGESHSSRVLSNLRAVREAYRASPVAGLAADADRALAPLFHGTYKGTPPADEIPGEAEAAAHLDDAEKPYQTVLKPTITDIRPVGREELLAALDTSAPSLPPLSEEAPPSPGGTERQSATGTTSSPDTFLTQRLLEPPHKILVVGDSLAIGLSLSLRRSVNDYEDVTLIEEGKVSSGLANPKYFNWEKALQAFVDKHSPSMVVVMMGANDAKYINLNEKPREPGSPNKTWSEVFSMRLETFLAIPAKRDLPVFWIGLPVMGDPTYARQAQAMNDIVRAECDKFPNCRFLDTWDLLCDPEDTYATFLKNDKGGKIKIRANDKVHFTVAGGDILARSFFDQASRLAVFRPKTEKTAASTTGEAPPATTANP
ncbi:MAG: DUF459 domain-containing protein [Thermodesulfobacteriota bacterium]